MSASHDHHGHNHGEVASGRLGLAAAVNGGFAVVQVVVGLYTGAVVVLAGISYSTMIKCKKDIRNY